MNQEKARPRRCNAVGSGHQKEVKQVEGITNCRNPAKTAICLPGSGYVLWVIRVAPHFYSSVEDVDRAVDALAEILAGVS